MIPVEQLRAVIRLLFPDEITPIAKQVLESICEQHDTMEQEPCNDVTVHDSALAVQECGSTHDGSTCETCGHLLSDHDGMGDCRHLDGRTATGFCTCGDKRGTT